MWLPFVKSVKELARFAQARMGFLPLGVHRGKTLRRTWSMAGVKASDVSLLQELAASARRIEDLTNHPGWKDVLEAKEYYQSLSDRKTKYPALSDHDRFQAAVEWAAIEGFFKEVYGRIQRGRAAEEKLVRLVMK